MNRFGFFYFWENSALRSMPNCYRVFGVASLLAYAFFQVLWELVGSPSETITALLGLIAFLFFGKSLRNSAAIWLLIAGLIIQVISWWLMLQYRPEWVPDNPQIDRLAKLFIFIAVAWWLGGSTKNTLLVWSLALAGFIIAAFFPGKGLESWSAGLLHGERVGFGVRNNQHASMLFGVFAIGLLVFSRRFIYRPNLVGWRLSLWLSLMSIVVLAILIGQTRAVWIGTLCAASMTVLAWFFGKTKKKENLKDVLKKAGIAVFVLAVAIGIAGWFLGNSVVSRVDAEHTVIAQVINKDFESIPYSSIGTRIHSWIAASEWISQRPLAGWGPWGRGLVMDHTSWLPKEIKDEYGHLHNFFIEMWVAYGVMGPLLIAALAIWIAQATWRAWRGGVLPNDMALFSICFFVYWMLVNQLESYMSFWTGVYVFNLVVGGLITHYWRWLLQVNHKGTPDVSSGSSINSSGPSIKESTAL